MKNPLWWIITFWNLARKAAIAEKITVTLENGTLKIDGQKGGNTNG
jgi:hypothetical protein